MINLDAQLREAVKHFWLTRHSQSESQGTKTGVKDAGLRSAVTGGKHLDGFVQICRDILIDAGLPSTSVYWQQKRDLPGYFRPEKNWDLPTGADGHLLAVIEFKGQVGPSFGNNFNNRCEEVLGNATDLWAAYREGAFKPSQRPWLGFLFLLEDTPASTRPLGVKQSHYPVFDEFAGSSYAKRYEILLTRLVRERLYDAACLLLTNKANGVHGMVASPNPELSFTAFATSLSGHATAFAKLRRGTL